MKGLILLILTLMAGDSAYAEILLDSDTVNFSLWSPGCGVIECSYVRWNVTCIYKNMETEIKGPEVEVKENQRHGREDRSASSRKSDSCDEDDVKEDVKELCQPPITHTAYKATNTTVSCSEKKINFFCKFNEKNECEDILTKKKKKSNGSFTLIKTKTFNVNMSISNVSSRDAGVYWCGRKSPCYRALLREIHLKVEDPPVPTQTSTTSTTVSSTSPHPVTKTLTVSSTSPHTVSTTSLSSTSSSTVSAESDVLSAPRGSRLTRIIVVVVCVAVLVLLIVLFLCFKRHRHFQNKKNENPTSKDEGHEVKSASGTGLKTIYVTAGMPTSPPPSEYYSTINLSYSAGQASDATYSTVQENNQTPEYSTINHPPGPGEDPFYSKLSHPQQN